MDTEEREKIRKLFKFSNLKDIEDICKTFCEEVTEKYNRQEKRVEAINKELTDLRSENWKDETLQDMKTQLEEMRSDYYRGFPISKSEYDAIQKWKDNHYNTQHNAKTNLQRLEMGGAIGGTFHYEFVPTSIGTSGSCVCGVCKNKAMREANGDRNKYRELLKKYDAQFEFQEIG